MKAVRTIGLVGALLLVALSAVAGYAQDDGRTALSPDGRVQFSYPAAWYLQAETGGYLLTNSPTVAVEVGGSLAAGEVRLALLLPDGIEQMGLGADVAAVDLLGMFAASLGGDASQVESYMVGDFEAFEFLSDLGEVQSLVTTLDLDGAAMLVWFDTAPGEMDQQRGVLDALLASITYSEPVLTPFAELAPITAANVDSVIMQHDLTNMENDYYGAAVSPDGRYVALNNGADAILLFDMETAEMSTLYTASEEEYLEDEIAFGPDGALAVYNGTETLLLGVPGGEQVGTIDRYLGGFTSLGAAYTYDWDTTTFTVFDAASGEDLGSVTPTGDFYDVTRPAFDAADETFVFGAGLNLYVISTADYALGDPLFSVEGEYNSIVALDISPDGSTVVFVDDEEQIRGIDVASGAINFEINRYDYDGSLEHVLFAPDGSLVYVVQRYLILVLDPVTGEILNALPQYVDGNLAVIDLSADSRVLVGAGYENAVVWGTGEK